jgi:hypothetical protein
MSKITTISRANLGFIQHRVNKALEELSKELGVAITTSGGRYSNAETGEIKLNLVVQGEAGAPVRTQAQIDFDRWHHALGVKKEDLGRQFTDRGTRYELTGAYPSSPKFVFQVKRVHDGKIFKFTRDGVLRGLGYASAVTRFAA